MQATAAVPRNQHDWTVDSKLHQGDPSQALTENIGGFYLQICQEKFRYFRELKPSAGQFLSNIFF